jgi:Domain of unknown function (DUF4148)
MKRALIGSLLFAAAMSSASVFAQTTGAANAAENAPITRAQVKAELAAAKKSGQLDLIHSETYPQLLPYQAARKANATMAR